MATTLSELSSPLANSAYAVSADLGMLQFESPLNNQIDPKGSNSVSQLIRQDGNAIDFSGLGAQAFQESLNVHFEMIGHLTDAFTGASKALSHFGDTVISLSSRYDGQLSTIKGTDYAPGFSFSGGDLIAEAARSAFLNQNPYTAMIDDVISAADGNAVLQDGASHPLNLLGSAYVRLISQAEETPIQIPPLVANVSMSQTQARQMVIASLGSLYDDISQVYRSWGTAIQQAFFTFQAGMKTVTQQVQPYIDILTQPTSAASIMAMISLISQSDEPISIVQTGPNSIMVFISGTNMSQLGYDTNVWNALGTGMGVNMPYEQDVIAAIEQYCAEHGLVNPQVTLAGHSLGGMVAQQVAEQRIFNVNQVITFGSPIMGPPVPGVKYDIYEADSDVVPLLSHYENPTLPTSLQDVANLFPGQVAAPMGNIDSKAIIILKDAGAAWMDTPGVLYLRSELDRMSPYLPPADRSLLNNLPGPLRPVASDVAGLQPYAGPQPRLQFMDPTGAYQGELQRVPDLPASLGLGVHSDYAQSSYLESQKIVQPMNLPASPLLSNVEYFGMPNEYKTAQINQYMQDHSTIGGLLSQLGG